MKNWFCVTQKDNYLITLSKNVWGVEERHKFRIDWIKKDDRIIFYIKGMKVGGAFRVISNPYLDTKEIFQGGLFPYRIKLEPIKLPQTGNIDWTYDIIQDVDFIKHKNEKWRFELMGRPIKPISEKDFNYLLSKL